MIRSWKDRILEEVSEGRTPKGFPADLAASTRRRLKRLEAAETLDELKSPPGHRLHALGGDREGQWSISVNDQFRLCFRWVEGAAEDVEFLDYH